MRVVRLSRIAALVAFLFMVPGALGAVQVLKPTNSVDNEGTTVSPGNAYDVPGSYDGSTAAATSNPQQDPSITWDAWNTTGKKTYRSLELDVTVSSTGFTGDAWGVYYENSTSTTCDSTAGTALKQLNDTDFSKTNFTATLPATQNLGDIEVCVVASRQGQPPQNAQVDTFDIRTEGVYDATPPEYRNAGQNTSLIPFGDSVELYAQGRDSFNLSSAILETNETGVYENKSVYGSPRTGIYSADTWEWTNFTWSNSSLRNGKVSWRIWYNDTAGFYNATGLSSFTVDSNPPGITVHAPANTTLGISTVDLNVTANETVSEWRYNLDTGGNNTFTPNTTLSVSDGGHNVTVWAQDQAGNWNSTTRFFSTDTTPPSFSQFKENPSDPAVFADGQSYRFNVTVDDSNLDRVQFEFEGSNRSVQSSGKEYYSDLSSLSAGNYSYRWYANDTVGNSNSSTLKDYEVKKAPVETSMLLNGTRGDRTYEYKSTANLTASLNVSGTLEIFANFSGSLQSRKKGSSPLEDILKLDFSLGDYLVKGVFFGNENYTADNESHLLEIEDTQKPVFNSAEDTEPGRLYKGKTFTTKTNWSDNYQLDSGLLSVNTSGSYSNVSSRAFNSGWANISYTYPTDTAPGTLGWKHWANDTSANYRDSPVQLQEVWGFSQSNITLNSTSVQKDEAVAAGCRVVDSNSSSSLQDYSVDLYNGSVLLDSGSTGAEGWFNTTFSLSEPQDDVPVKCAIYENVSRQYTPVSNGSEPLTVNAGLPPKLYNDSYGINTSSLVVSESLKAYARWNTSLNWSYAEYDTLNKDDYTDDYSQGPFTANWTNFTITSGTDWFKGTHSVKLYANDSQGNLNDTLSRLEFNVSGYSNVSYESPTGDVERGTTELEAKVLDANSSDPVSNYNVSFWNNGTFIGANTTNSSGTTVYSWNTASKEVGPTDVKVNISDSDFYTAVPGSDSENATFNLTGNLNPQISDPSGILNRGNDYSLSGSVEDNTGSSVTPDNATWTNSTGDTIGTGEFDTWSVPGDYTLGPETVNFSVEKQYFTPNWTTRDVTIYGYARIEAANFSRDRINEGETTEYRCRVGEQNNAKFIEDYQVDFSDPGGSIGSNLTNSTGWATIAIDNPDIGNTTYECKIGDNTTQYYNDSAPTADTAKELEVVDTTPPNYTVTKPSSSSGFKRNTRKFEADFEDNFDLETAYFSFNDSGSYENQSTAISGTSTTDSVNFGNTSFRGLLGYRVYVEDFYGNFNSTGTRTFTVYAASNLSSIDTSDSVVPPGDTTQISCTVEDNVTSNGISGYTVDLYNESGFQKSTTTDGSGVATFDYTRNVETTDTVECRISDDLANYYKTDASSIEDTVQFEFGRSSENATSVENSNGNLEGRLADLEFVDGSELSWTGINASLTQGTDYILVNSSTEIPPSTVEGVDFEWHLRRIVDNFVAGINDPGGNGAITFTNGDPNATHYVDTENAQITEASQGNTYELAQKGFNYYLPETESEVTYNRLEFHARIRGDGTEEINARWNNFATGNSEPCLKTVSSNYVNVSCSLTSTATIADVISTDQVYVAFNDTNRQNSDSQTTWEVDRSYISAEYVNPSTGNVYNYTAGYRNRTSSSLQASESFNLSGTREFFSANTTVNKDSVSDIVAPDGKVTGYLTLFESGTPNTQAYRENDVFVDKFNARVRYQIARVKSYEVDVKNSTGDRVRGVNFTVVNNGTVIEEFSSFDSNFTDKLGENQNYTVRQSLPVDGEQYNVSFREWNVSESVTPDTEFVNYSSLNEELLLENVSYIYAVDDTGMSYDKATLKVPKRKGTPDTIIHCTDYNFGSSSCDEWQVNSTSDYPSRETSTHFVFNVTGFDAFGTAQGSTLPNVTNISIYDTTGVSAAEKETGGTLEASGLNTTFDVDQEQEQRQYRFQFKVVNNGTLDWSIAAEDQLFHDGLNSSWNVVRAWYNLSNGDYDGAQYSDTNVTWDTSQGGVLEATQGNNTMYAKYLVNISTNRSQVFDQDFKVNDTSENSGSTDNHVFNLTKYGKISVEVTNPPNETSVSKDQVFQTEAFIECLNGYCGNVTANVRYNESDTADTLIPGSGTPFELSGDTNLKQCGILNSSNNCSVSWDVNATGSLNSVHLLDSKAESDLSRIQNNNSTDIQVSIKETVEINLQYNTVDFGLVQPGEENVSAPGNFDMSYNLTVPSYSAPVEELWVRSTDLVTDGFKNPDTGTNYTIYAENVSIAKENTTSNETGLQESFFNYASSIASDTNFTTYYYLDAPEGIKNSEYNGTIYFKANESS